jgi:hypothetical protein
MHQTTSTEAMTELRRCVESLPSLVISYATISIHRHRQPSTISERSLSSAWSRPVLIWTQQPPHVFLRTSQGRVSHQRCLIIWVAEHASFCHSMDMRPNKSLEPTAAPLSGLGLLLRKTLAGWLRPFFTCARAHSNAQLPFRAAGSSRVAQLLSVRQRDLPLSALSKLA